MPKKPVSDLSAFEAALLQSADDAASGRHARVHTREQISARRRGRPLGSTADVRKTATTIRFDADVIEAFRATGRGWQTRINDALREWLKTHQPG